MTDNVKTLHFFEKGLHLPSNCNTITFQNEYNCIANVLVLHIKEVTFGVGEGWDSKKINEKRGYESLESIFIL